ncbi:anion permease, partial [Nocardioides sp. SOB77]
GGRELIAREHAQLGPMKPGEWVTLIVFLLAAIAWILRTIIERYIPGLSDSGIAMIAAMILFVVPVQLKKREFVMNWSTAAKLPWGILILFGG